jgi:hypothetical protein
MNEKNNPLIKALIEKYISAGQHQTAPAIVPRENDSQQPQVPQVRPWVRYWARAFDLFLFSCVVALAVLFLIGIFLLGGTEKAIKERPSIDYKVETPQTEPDSKLAQLEDTPSSVENDVTVSPPPLPLEQKLLERVTLEFKNTPIEDALALIADIGDIDIVKSPSVTGYVTANPINMTVEESLDNILAPMGYGYVIDGNIVKIAPMSEIGEIIRIDPSLRHSPTIATQPKGTVTGIVYSIDKPLALIDKQVVYEGDTINGAKVIKIHKDKVEFEKDGNRWTQEVGVPTYPSDEFNAENLDDLKRELRKLTAPAEGK